MLTPVLSLKSGLEKLRVSTRRNVVKFIKRNDQDKSQLLSEMDRPDGSSIVAGLSIQSGISGGIQHHVRLTVGHDLRRRPSVDSGVNSLGERLNYEEASTRAMAGSNYHYDDKVALSVRTFYSGHELVSYSDEAASTMVFQSIKILQEDACLPENMIILNFQALAGDAVPFCSYAFFRMYTGEISMLHIPRRRSDRIRLVVAYPRKEDAEQTLLLTDEPGSSGQLCAGAGDLLSLTSPKFTQPDSREELDPFKIRALLDNMKQMVASNDVDKCHETAGVSCTFRSGAGTSLSSVAGQSFEVGPDVVEKRRGILRSLFSSEKNDNK
ncbi:hypothetical protein NECAME_10357 [Necator americanus]|uniref:Uncharacterized protein n=1 Tax=Necator americanus TaxID=51031 RepID=W2TB43_NECAM|nr:hypothetical protein NECAME_10357 [Necator americanus]ETN78411.1 hypothetical protein NECAME_10357 [Necator americanus]